MPKLGLGLGLAKPLIGGGGSAPVIPSSGLSLWLKADAGVSKFSFNYISEIIISGTSNANVNGTYTATSVPSYDFSNGYPAEYFFSGPSNGFSMNWEDGGLALTKYFDNGEAIFSSSDGQTWTIASEVLTQVVISGFEDDYEGANDIYNYNDGYEAFVNGDETYAIYGTAIENIDTDEVLATNSNANYSGNWTLVNGIGDPETTSVTIIPNGSISGITTTSTANTDFVSAWADQSGNGRNASPIDEGPTYNSSVINSKPAIDFSLTALSGPIGFNFANDNTLFIVFKARNVTAGALWGQGDGEFIAALTGGYTQISNYNVEGVVTSNTASSVNTTYLFASRNSSNNFTIYLNGNQTGSASYNSFTGVSTSQFIGADVNVDYSYDGYISEIIVYNRAVTTPERQQVEAYLNTKYAIY
jgi:hypothetical protein